MIVKAAIRVEGKVLTGKNQYAIKNEQQKAGASKNFFIGAEYGFIDDFGRFLTDKEACTKAYESGQLKIPSAEILKRMVFA